MASPLSVFRKYQYVALVALGVLAIVSFVILPPINDYLMSARQSGGPEGKQVVLTWTNGKVRESELRSMQNAHNLTMNFLEAIAQAASAKKGQPKDPYNLARRDPSEQAVVARMILAEKAERLGVVVSDDTIEDYIYQISGGVLEPAELNELLRTATGRRLTRQMLFTELRREMLAMTMRQMAFSGLSAAPPAANWLHFNRLRETAVLELVPLPVEDFVGQLKKEPTAEELRTLYDKYKNDFRNPNTPEPGFRRPDQINFGYFRLDFERFLAEAKQQITDEEIQAEYEQGLTRGDFRRPQLPPSSPPATPAPPASDEATTPMNGQPATETESDAPAETPATEEPAAEEPAAEEPATEEPATEEPATEEPATEEPATEEPATEEPATEEPASESSNGGCDTQEPAEPAETEPEEAQETPPATESGAEADPATPAQPEPSAEAAPAADGETPPTDAAAAEAPPSEPAPGETAPGEEAAPPSAPETTLPAAPENRTLEEVREEILLKLARPKAREHREQVKTELRNQLQTYFQEYTLWRSQVRTGAKSAPKPTPPDYEQLASQYGIEYESTGLVDPFQAEKTELGQTSRLDFQARAFVPFVQIAFDPEVQLFSPREIDNRETGDIEYLYWKSDHKDAYVPEFNEIRVEVEDTWKRLEARKLAEKQAQQLQKQAAGAEGSLKERLPDYAERVQQTNEFSWLTMGNLGSLFSQQPQLSSVEGVDGVTWDFMETVFGLKEGEVGVATNAAETVYYVVRVVERSPSQEVLRERFLREFPLGGMQQTLPLLQEEQRAYYQQWYNQLEEEMKVNWARLPDQMPAERS